MNPLDSLRDALAQYRWRPARGPFSRRERTGSEVARWGAEWNVAWLAPCGDGAEGSQPGRIEVRDATEIQSCLIDG